MNKFFTLLILSSFLFSCGEKDLSCGSELAKKTVIDILKESETENAFAYGLSGMKKSDVEKIFDENVDITQIRTTNIDDRLKKCECEGTLIFNVDDDVKKAIRETGDNFLSKMVVKEILAEKGIEIYYNLQETEDGEIYAETYELEGLTTTIVSYHNLIRNARWNNENTQTFESKDGYVTYILKFLNPNRIEITFNQGTHEEIFEVDYNNGIVSNPNFEDDPKNPQFKLEKDNLKVKDKPNGGYSTYYRK